MDHADDAIAHVDMRMSWTHGVTGSLRATYGIRHSLAAAPTSVSRIIRDNNTPLACSDKDKDEDQAHLYSGG